MNPSDSSPSLNIDAALQRAFVDASENDEGKVASYIPELSNVDADRCSAAVMARDGSVHSAGDPSEHVFTLQSAAKLITLVGVLEEQGPDAVFEVVGAEPSGESFSSIARLDRRGPRPANPLVNSGAIALCGVLDGSAKSRIEWIQDWAQRLCGRAVTVNARVCESEKRTGDRNRSIAHLMRSTGILRGDVDDTLDTYFALCSLDATVVEAAHLGYVLAFGGINPEGRRVISQETTQRVVGIMASCGMYDESGTYLMETGLPAKSGVSGVIVASALGNAGIGVCCPRLNQRGGSVRGHLILRSLSRSLGWHFAGRSHGR